MEKYEAELVDHDSQETASYMQSRTGQSEMLGCDNKWDIHRFSFVSLSTKAKVISFVSSMTLSFNPKMYLILIGKHLVV